MMTYLLPMAKCTETGETVKTQDLSGNRFTLRQRALAQEVADQIAEKMNQRTNKNWTGFVKEYIPTSVNL